MKMHFQTCWFEMFFMVAHTCTCVFRHLLPGTCFWVMCECSLAVCWEFRLCNAATNCVSAVCAPVPSQHIPAAAGGSPASLQVKAGWPLGKV